MALDVVRAAIASGIAAKVPSLRSVGVHGGAFDDDSLRRYAINSPCGVVVLDGARKSDWQSNNLGLYVDCACFIIIHGTSAESRDKASLRIVYDVVKAVHANLWNSELTRAPTNINWVNLYSGAIDKQGMSIQAVTWEQVVVVDASLDLATLDDLELVATTFDLPGSELETPFETNIELEVLP